MEENNDSTENNTFKLLQPELMTVRELCEILQGCCVKNDLTSFNKNELVELFKRVALPLPQRNYTSNSWREKLLNRNQKRKTSTDRNKIKKICITNGSSKNSTSISAPSIINTPRKSIEISSSESTASSSKLKPPINSNNYTKKILKLSLGNSKVNESNVTKKLVNNESKFEIKEKTSVRDHNKIIIKDSSSDSKEKQKIIVNSTSSNEKRPDKQPTGKHKRIVIDFSDSSTSTTKTPKLINLKRSTGKEESVCTGQKLRKINI